MLPRGRSKALPDDAGNAAIEFLTAGVILLVPLVYLGLALAAIQGASLAVEGAAREAARVYVSAATDAAGRGDADRAVDLALADQRIGRRSGDLTLACDGSRVTATVRTELELPFVPPVLGLDRVARVRIEATAVAPVFRGGPAP